MLQGIDELKGVVSPRAVENNITSSWRDFWHFEVVSDGSEHVTVGMLAIAIGCFVAGILISRWFSRRLSKRIFSRFDLAPSAHYMWTQITFYVSCLLVTVIALKIAHVPLTIFTFLGGALALGIGFGSRNIVNNFISGLIFLFEGPAKVGDLVEVENLFGKVTEVGLRATHIELTATKHAVIPNSSFLEKPIINWGRAGRPTSVPVAVNVAHGTNIDELEILLQKKITGIPQAVAGIPIKIDVKGFTDSAICIEVSVTARMFIPGDRDDIASALRRKLNELFGAEHIATPVPQLMLHRPPELEKK